ncbi:MAG: hypothetical protein M3Y69_00630 [Verrucomicrobiota bacterium]|nr:hypothetical protein [Verrucomicrobiota bacterium]
MLIQSQHVGVEFVRLEYDHEQLASEMRAEDLPEEYIETIETGCWTTCLEVLPIKEGPAPSDKLEMTGAHRLKTGSAEHRATLG